MSFYNLQTLLFPGEADGDIWCDSSWSISADWWWARSQLWTRAGGEESPWPQQRLRPESEWSQHWSRDETQTQLWLSLPPTKQDEGHQTRVIQQTNIPGQTFIWRQVALLYRQGQNYTIYLQSEPVMTATKNLVKHKTILIQKLIGSQSQLIEKLRNYSFNATF